MNNYQFELVFALLPNEDGEAYTDALFEAGCGDAGVGVGKLGSIALMFDREAKSAHEAVESAIANVLTAIPHARLERTDKYLMNLSEIAELVGTTKQNLSKYANGKSTYEAFPSPRIVSRSGTFWYFTEVASWFEKNKLLQIEPPQVELSRELYRCNQVIDEHRAIAV